MCFSFCGSVQVLHNRCVGLLFSLMILISTKLYSFVCVRVRERVLYLAFLYVASVKIAANDCMCEMDFIEG